MSTSRTRIIKGFAVKIVLPALLTVVLYLISFFYIFLPAFERKIIDDKREMIRELTDTAWCVLEESEQKVKDGEWSKAEAQRRAIERVKDLRYGPSNKDYFWITDLTPKMIMHPYRPELDGKSLADYTGYNNKRLFVEFADIAKKQGSGYSEYLWQWMDDPNRVVLKLSYVKIFKPWNWIIGTGIYLDDVRREIAGMERRLTVISLVIITVVAGLLFLIILQGYRTERQRLQAEKQLSESNEKYRMLVGAATEGLIMILDGNYSYANAAMLKMLQCEENEFAGLDVFDLNSANPEDDSRKKYIVSLLNNESVPMEYETRLRRKDGEWVDAVLVSSKISIGEREGFVIIVKDVSGRNRMERRSREAEQEKLIVELQTSLLAMNQPVSRIVAAPVSCPMQKSIADAAKIMARKKSGYVLLTTDDNEYVGIVTQSDISRRAVAGNTALDHPVFEIMTSPVVSIASGAPVFEAALIMTENKVRHLAVRDGNDKIVSVITARDMLQLQRGASTTLFKEIENAESVDDIKENHTHIAFMVKALVDTGANPSTVTGIISSVADLITHKFLVLAMEELGEPPVKFAFMTLGSEGRGEETLFTDQDNAIIYEDPEPDKEKEVSEYFIKLGTRICDWLNEVGFSFCKGDVMAKNPKWCTSYSTWEKHFTSWITEAEPDELLKFNIFFDFRRVYGEQELTANLRQMIDELLTNNKAFFIHLSRNCLLYKPPLTMFGNITVKSGEDIFNVKEALKPVTNFARIYALENGIREVGTITRLDRLLDREAIGENTHDDLRGVYNYLMLLRLKHQVRAIGEGRQPDNDISLAELTNIERETLRNVLSRIKTMQSTLSFHFKGSA